MHVKKTVWANGVAEQKYLWIFAFIAFLPVVFMAQNRSLWHADTSMYIDRFWSMPTSPSGISAYLDSYPKDKGFSIFSIMIKSYITKDYRIYLLIIALLQGLCLVSVYRKYSPDYLLSIALFIISTDYVAWMHNGIRQFLAVCIIFAATGWILKRKYVPLIILIVFASFFHQSALLMIPIVVILQGKAWNKKTLWFIFAIILAITFVGRFTNLLDSTLEDTQYSNMVSDYTASTDDGTNPIRVLVYSVPTILAFIGREKIAKTDDPLIHMCVNASIVSTGLYVVSMFTSGIFLGRLPIYVSLYNYILLPWEIKHIIPAEYRNATFIAMFLFYGAFYYYQLGMTWGLI